jgi:hypothetical protein
MKYQSFTPELIRQSVRKCTKEDIVTHYSTVSHILPSGTSEKYKTAMLKSIEESTAYCLVDGSCFLYYTRLDRYKSNGLIFYGDNNPLGMLALFTGVFSEDIDPNTKLLSFTPHKNEGVIKFKSFLTIKSIRKWYEFGTPVVIRVDLFKLKIETLIKKLNWL